MEDIFGILQSVIGNDFTKYSGSEVITPKWVVSDMVDLLPAEVFVPEARFLDLAVKSGRFLIELHNRLMDSPLMISVFPDEKDRHEHIIRNQLYGFATSAVAATIVRKALYGDPTIAGNIVYVDRYLVKMADKTTDFKKLVQGEFGEDMKFDVVIGNPPYQESTGEKGRAVPIYQKFVNNGFKVAPIVCMITPSRWFSASDNGSKEMRTHILGDGTYKIAYFERSNDVFEGVNFNGGVSYFATNKNRHGNTEIAVNGNSEATEKLLDTSIFIPSKHYRNITNKVRNTRKFIDNTVFSQNAFGLDTNYLGILGDIKVRTSSGCADGIYKDDIPKGQEYVSKYKVITGSMNTTSIINNPEILDTQTICTSTYTVLWICETQGEAVPIKKYFMTRFVRALIDATLNNQRVSRDNYRFIPLQDFTASSDIDWSQSVADIDKQLYKKYGLTKEEQDYIESTIKPME